MTLGDLISIHTTLAGGDTGLDGWGIGYPNFNPHHPRGLRPQHLLGVCVAKQFQSTPPSRVATLTAWLRERRKQFQSTPSSRVATSASPDLSAEKRISIHTTLAGGDMSDAPTLLMCNTISIHTTLAGGDDQQPIFSGRYEQFQSTPPSRVATCQLASDIWFP